jgi:hypothetical protein
MEVAGGPKGIEPGFSEPKSQPKIRATPVKEWPSIGIVSSGKEFGSLFNPRNYCCYKLLARLPPRIVP